MSQPFGMQGPTGLPPTELQQVVGVSPGFPVVGGGLGGLPVRSFGPPPGQEAFTTAGTFSWVAPAGVTSVSVVAVGAGGGGCISGNVGGGGGALGFKNNYAVTPGNSYSVVVGAGARANTGGNSHFCSSAVVQGGGGKFNQSGTAATFVGDGGGNGGIGRADRSSGAGAGGYSGKGGDSAPTGCGLAGAGGGGGSGATSGPGLCFGNSGGGGGGVGLLGQGSNGAKGIAPQGGGGGGSGGTNGGTNDSNFFAGGAFGGGGGMFPAGSSNATFTGTPSGGAVRVIWPGNIRSFPSTCTGDL